MTTRGTETRSAKTEGLGPKDDGPVPSGTRPNPCFTTPNPILEGVELREAYARVREALEQALRFLENAPLESGICCCGIAVDDHSIGSGHGPVDDLAYGAGQVADLVREALKATPLIGLSQGEGGGLIGVREAAQDLLDRKDADPRTVGYRDDLWACLRAALQVHTQGGFDSRLTDNEKQGNASLSAADRAGSLSGDGGQASGDASVARGSTPLGCQLQSALSLPGRDADADSEIVALLRDRTKALLGGNATFADDDVHILIGLARRAVEAGLTDGLNPSVLKSIRLSTVQDGSVREALAWARNALESIERASETVCAATSSATYEMRLKDCGVNALIDLDQARELCRQAAARANSVLSALPQSGDKI